LLDNNRLVRSVVAYIGSIVLTRTSLLAVNLIMYFPLGRID